MSVHGNFTELTFTNGSGVAINAANLNAIESTLKITDTELATSTSFNWDYYKDMFFNCSTKTVERFLNYKYWSETNGATVSEADHDECLIHGRGVKMLQPSVDSEELAIYNVGVSPQLNLETFQSGDTSSTADLMCVLVYISDTTYITKITMRFGTDNSNYYKYDYSASLLNGWNMICIPKSSFSTVGSISNWTAIDYISFRATFEVNSDGEYVIWNHCALVRADSSTATLMNPFVANDESDNWDVEIMTPSSQFLIYKDSQLEEICITNVLVDGVAVTDPDFLGTGLVCSSFTGVFRLLIKSTTYSQGIMWYVDDDNWLLYHFDDESLEITERYGGSTSHYYTAISTSLVIGSTILINIEKIKGGESRIWGIDESGNNTFLEASVEGLNFSDSEEGELGIGAVATTNKGIIQDFVVSNRKLDRINATNNSNVKKMIAQSLIIGI